MATSICHDLSSLLSTKDRDFLIRNNGDQVKIKDISGKIVGLYFSASWCPHCRTFTPTLVKIYNELTSKGDVEIVFISSDKDEESFNNYFSKMPWLAVPFSESTSITSIKGNFSFRGIPHLVFLNGDGYISTEDGVKLVMEHQAEAYPFSSERVNDLKQAEDEARRNQSLKSLLVSSSRDFVISSDGTKIPVSELQGKIVALYFCISSYTPSSEFNEKLTDVYKKLKEKGENFEIVSIFMDNNNNTQVLEEVLSQMAWFALPFKDEQIETLARYFELRTIPRLVIIGPNGQTLNHSVAELIDEHGIEAYPFTSERLVELSEIEKAKFDSQTLEDILVSGDKDYVIDNSGAQVPISQLVGKHLLLYFSAHWCPPCRSFTPKLVETYHEIKSKENAFEVIFVSRDRDQSLFDQYYSHMPWLALPFGDQRKASLSRRFNVKGIPFLVAIGRNGKTVTTETRHLVAAFGADAFPFTEDHINELKKQFRGNSKKVA
ncbi:putative nucleoredoxin 1 [Silene latifolia]|uniref:putative nucleoredoxin 1 n=1 Tax=Silene latifolia TaxID=37657 RepID=UPI003D77782B